MSKIWKSIGITTGPKETRQQLYEKLDLLLMTHGYVRPKEPKWIPVIGSRHNLGEEVCSRPDGSHIIMTYVPIDSDPSYGFRPDVNLNQTVFSDSHNCQAVDVLLTFAKTSEVAKNAFLEDLRTKSLEQLAEVTALEENKGADAKPNYRGQS